MDKKGAELKADLAYNTAKVEEIGVKVVRLISGEDVLAKVTVDPRKVGPSLQNPVIVLIRPDPTGQKATIAMTDWLPYMKGEKVDLNYTAVVAIVDPQDSLVEYWNKNFGDKKSPNIIMPIKPKLVGV